MTKLLSAVADIDSEMSALNAKLSELREQRKELEEKIVAAAAESGEGVSGNGYKVRFNPGRTVVKWQADQLALTLPPALREVAVTEITTFQANAAVLKALEESGKLPAEALEWKEITPPNGRWVLEKE